MARVHALLVMLLAVPAAADVVHLKDGSKVEGTIKRDSGGWIVTDAAGKPRYVGDDLIESVEKTSKLSPAELADGKLTTLRHNVESLTDLGQIIDRYNKFIEQNKGTPAAAQAQKELAVWKDRQAKKMIKAGSQWVTGDEQAAMLEKSVAAVDQARSLMKAGRMREAGAVVDQILAVDTKSASGFYLRGVLAFKQDQVGAAKKAFEMSRDALADHGPTLNNLAVIAWQQKQAPLALLLYDQAMAAAPRMRLILDNVAELLNAIPEEQRSSAQYKKLAKHFAEQDAELQKQLVQEGLYRWGSTFVPQSQMDELKKAQAKVAERLHAMEEDYNRLKDRGSEIDHIVARNETTMRNIESDRMRQDSNGNIIRLPLPGAYYDILRENDRLREEQRSLLDKMASFRDKAMKVKQELPVPQYKGVQQIIEADGTPLGAPKGPPPAAKPVQ